MTDPERDDPFASPLESARDADRTKHAAERFEDSEANREVSLRKELDGVRNINELIEGVLGTLERAKGNMQVSRSLPGLHRMPNDIASPNTNMKVETVSNTVNTASTLLNTWTRILSQTEHNQRLILNPSWKGATQDLTNLENETLQRQQAAERRAAEEEKRRAEFHRRQEEEQKRQAASTSTASTRGSRGLRGSRARNRSAARGVSSSYVSETTSSSIGSVGSRGTSGIGRGFGSVRGRPRGGVR